MNGIRESGRSRAKPAIFPSKAEGSYGGGRRTVFIVDDDFRVRDALSDLLATVGLHAETFGSATEYVRCFKQDSPGCLLLDVELPDINGLDLQDQLDRRLHPPIIFITGHGDIPLSVKAIKAGAIDFLPKPIREAQLLKAIDAAFAEDLRLRITRRDLEELGRRYSLLTPREREVLALVVSGLLNKQAAGELGISEVTLQIHRGRVMRKMAANSLADLVRMTEKLQMSSFV